MHSTLTTTPAKNRTAWKAGLATMAVLGAINLAAATFPWISGTRDATLPFQVLIHALLTIPAALLTGLAILSAHGPSGKHAPAATGLIGGALGGMLFAMLVQIHLSNTGSPMSVSAQSNLALNRINQIYTQTGTRSALEIPTRIQTTTLNRATDGLPLLHDIAGADITPTAIMEWADMAMIAGLTESQIQEVLNNKMVRPSDWKRAKRALFMKAWDGDTAALAEMERRARRGSH